MTIDTMPGDDAVFDALREVFDPEAGISIVDLGLVYGLEVQPAAVRVTMTMTTAACPMTETIVDEVREAIAEISPPDTRVDVELVWDPPWTPDRMTGIAREQFGWT